MVSPCLQFHLTRGVPKVRDLHAVQPDGRRADVVGQVDDELEQQTRKVPSLGPRHIPSRRTAAKTDD